MSTVGTRNWSVVAKRVPSRVGKQCRERWHNHLCPDVVKCDWTEEEQWRLYLSHKLYGNKWTLISRYIKGRTDNSIKNHWNSKMRWKMAAFKEKLDRILEKIGENMSKKRKVDMTKKILDDLVDGSAESLGDPILD